MSPEVTAAWIAAGVGVLTVAVTVVAQYFSRRATSRDTHKALAQQSEHLDRTLTEQREQLDKTLAEQRTRTLSERFAAAAGQLGSDKPPEVRLAGVYAMAGIADDWEENRQTCVDVLCTTAVRSGRQLGFRHRRIHEALTAARAGQVGDAWQHRYRIRAWVRGHHRPGHPRHRHPPRPLPRPAETRLEHNTAAAAINLIRLDAWWTGRPLDRTRTTHLQRLDLAA